MSKESRLCYHAVPKIMKTDIAWVNAPLNEAEQTGHCTNDRDDDSDAEVTHRKKRRLAIPSDKDYNDAFDGHLWNSITNTDVWQPFADYITDCRINMNVRQVLEQGEDSLNS